MMLGRFPITPKGHVKLGKELQHLKNDVRPSIIAAIAEARSHGDLSENAEYAAAKEKQGMVEAKIADLEAKLACAEVIEIGDIKSDKIQFGAVVEVVDTESEKTMKYRIVGDYEADLNNGEISIFSPLAQALLGKIKDDEVEVTTPKGIRCFKIISIIYGNVLS
ncbi:transcription elongation factor GreA [Alphaproteobacteria bacterium]